jgi:hypothetical protein
MVETRGLSVPRSWFFRFLPHAQFQGASVVIIQNISCSIFGIDFHLVLLHASTVVRQGAFYPVSACCKLYLNETSHVS